MSNTTMLNCCNHTLEQIQMRMLNIKQSPTNNFAASTVSTSGMCSSGYCSNKSYQLEPFKFSTPHTPSHPTQMFLSKKQETPLKKIVNYDRAINNTSSKLKTQTFLRNTSFIPFDEDKSIPILMQGSYNERADKKEDKWPRYKNPSTPTENKTSGYQKILEKINKKQKLIEQLKELSKTSITDMIKMSNKQAKEKVSYNNILNKTIRNGDQNKRSYFSQPNKEKNQPSDTSKNVKIDFNRSTVEYRKPTEPSLVTFKEKLQIKIPERPKNPQEQRSNLDFKKAKNSYYTHRAVKSSDNIDEIPSSPSIGLYKKYSLVDGRQKQAQILYQTSRYSYENTFDLSPLTPKGQESKSISAMRQKRVPSNVTYFSNRNTTIYNFQLLKILGQGRFGTVVQAIHKQTCSIYAIKKISKKVIKENQMIEQLIKEIKIQSYCHHENIIEIYGTFSDKQFVYLVLEYMEEGTLFHQLKKRKIFSEKETALKIKHVAQAVVYLHEKGIAHRDIKPENIVLSNGIGKLCDFGWATLCDSTRRKTYCGTFDYAAPQILQGVEYDMSVDLWCLGILTYELLVGKAPFYHISRKQTMKKIINVENEPIVYPSHISKVAVSFVESLIKKNPQDRLCGTNILNHPFLLLAKQNQK